MCLISAKESTIWYNTPNVVENVNNKLFVEYDDGGGAVEETLEFDSGLYSFNTLATQLEVLLSNVGWSNIITLVSNDSTQKAGLKFNVDNVSVLFDGKTETLGELIGFTDGLDKTASAGQTVYGNTTANFAQLQYYLISCDLLKNGISLNGVYRKILVRIVPQVGTQVGSQIFHAPFNPSKIRDDSLLNRSIHTIRFTLTDQNGEPVNTLNENYTVTLAFEYF
ncbi:MAG TPA: hypothetical protein ENG48_12340 [Candidatus Atribacteria bacterium]|nr:hypothetical protein [Candidatus Atribacteria bacterium]